jgi:hypothetical protein
MRLQHLVLFLSIVVITSCIPTIPATPPTEGDWQLLVATDEQSSRLVQLSQPNNNIINQNLFLNADSMRGIGGRISKIAFPTGSFREYVFVILPDQRRIDVLSSTTYRRVARLDFSAQNRIPADIIAVNATSGYIAFSNTSVLGVVDFTNFTVPRDIPIGRSPVALDVLGNQVFCAVRDENIVAVVDTRLTGAAAVTARIPVPTAPEYIRLTPNGSELVVISQGGTNPRTAARASLISVQERRVSREATLFVNPTDSLTERAHGLVVTEREFAFIPMNNTLLRFDIRSLARATIADGVYRAISYNPIRAEVVFADSARPATCTILNALNDSTKAILRLESVNAFPRHIFSR